MEPLILSVDCGTQSLRVMLINQKGNIVAGVKKAFDPYYATQPGFAEQDPEVYWNSLCEASKELLESHQHLKDAIQACVVCTLRDSYVNLGKDGKVLRPVIIWLDQRAATQFERISAKDKLMFEMVGMNRTIKNTQRHAKANWIKEHQPEIWDKTYKYLLVSGFLNYKLTGRFADSVASQIAHLPFDYKRQCWVKSKSSWKWPVFGVEADKLCELVPPGDVLGEITQTAAEKTGLPRGLKVIAGGSDKGCETMANGCVDTRCASISFGTTATIQTTSKKYLEPIQFFPSYPSVIENHYNPEVEIFRGYWMIGWFKKEFAAHEQMEAEKNKCETEQLLNKKLEEIPPGSLGLMLQPYWGPHVKTPDAKGSIIGFGDVHTRLHVYRAIIEGINYSLMEGMEWIERCAGSKTGKIVVSGGGSKSLGICKITADMFGLPVYQPETNEMSALGAAMIGFKGIGVYKDYDEAVKQMTRYKNVFEPKAENRAVYKELFQDVYKKIYPRLKLVYSNIQRITGYPKH